MQPKLHITNSKTTPHQQHNSLILISFFLVLDAVFMPFRPFWGDAQIYGLQLLNSSFNGEFSKDLFLAYGSHDSFSLFTRLAAPISSMFGVTICMGLFYILGKISLGIGIVALLKWLGLANFTQLIFIFIFSVSSLPYGGLESFKLHEFTFTPRELSVGLGLLGFSWIADNKISKGAILQLLAISIHPLMGGVTACASIALRILPYLKTIIKPTILILLVGMVIITILSTVPRTRTYEFVNIVTPHLFISNWSENDLLRVFCILVILLASILSTQNSKLKDLALISAMFVIVSLTFAYCFELSKNLILLSLQPFRVLWFSTLVGLISSCSLIDQIYHSNQNNKKALIVSIVFISLVFAETANGLNDRTFLFVLSIIPISIFYRGISKLPRDNYWCDKSFFAGGILTCILLFSAEIYGIISNFNSLTDDPLTIFWKIALVMDRSWIWILGFLIIKNCGLNLRLVYTAAPILSLFFVFAPTTNIYKNLFDKDKSFKEQVKKDLQKYRETKNNNSNDRAKIYWAGHQAELWFDIGATSYFSLYQLSGSIYSPQKSIEAIRRFKIVAQYENLLYSAEGEGKNKFNNLLAFSLIDSNIIHQEICRDEILYGHITKTNKGNWVLNKCSTIFPHDNHPLY